MPLGARHWHYAAELHTLSVTYPLCGLALTNTTDNPSEMCPLKLTYFCWFLYHWSYTILQGPLIPPMAFTSCHNRGSNRLPPDGRASTLTTQPLRLAWDHILATIVVYSSQLYLVLAAMFTFLLLISSYSLYRSSSSSSILGAAWEEPTIAI